MLSLFHRSIFDQDYATAMYGKEQRMEGEKVGEKIGRQEGEKVGRQKGAIEATVKMCRRFGTTIDEAIHMLAKDFGLSLENASQYVSRLWKD